MHFSITIPILTQPEGSHNTNAYGKTEDNGLVHITQENQWLRVSYLPEHQVTPSQRDTVIYYAYRPEFSLFSASAEQLDNNTPDYITFPTEYTELQTIQDQYDSWHVIWHGTQTITHKNDQTNITKFFPDIEDLTDDEWEEYNYYHSIYKAYEYGYETEKVARKHIPEKLFNSFEQTSGHNQNIPVFKNNNNNE